MRDAPSDLRRRGHFERRTLAPQRRKDVRPEHDRVVVAFVEAQPGDGPRRLLRLAPGPEQRRLAAAGRRGDERDLDTRAGAKPFDQAVTRERVVRRGGGCSFVINRGGGRTGSRTPLCPPTVPSRCLAARLRRSLLGQVVAAKRRTPPRYTAGRAAMFTQVKLRRSARPRLLVREARRTVTTATLDRDVRRLRGGCSPGDRAGHVPCGKHDLHRPRPVRPVEHAIRVLFLPQVATAIAASLLGAGLARRFGTKRV